MPDAANGREASLNDFDTQRVRFENAIRSAPDAALRFKPAGEDYTLGGLVVHVAQVLRKYTAVLEAMQAADWAPVDEPRQAASDGEADLIRDGFDGSARLVMLDDMRGAHTRLVEAVRATPEARFTTPAAVTFAGSQEPYPTSPADVLGWVLDHYTEHTQQVADLLGAWSDATR